MWWKDAELIADCDEVDKRVGGALDLSNTFQRPGGHVTSQLLLNLACARNPALVASKVLEGALRLGGPYTIRDQSEGPRGFSADAVTPFRK